MKFALAFTPVLLSAASAAAVEKRQVTEFDISNFVAGCTTSGTCSWSFNLAEVPGGPSTTCSGTATAGTGNLFPATSGIKLCADTGVNFIFQRVAVLNVHRLVINDQHTAPSFGGSHAFANGDFSTASGAEVYTGPTSFVIVLPTAS